MNSDIIAEFKVLTNGQQAEFGRASGANITVVFDKTCEVKNDSDRELRKTVAAALT